MASIKVKLRESTVKEREGVLTIQVINNRKVKCFTTRFHIFPHEWDKEKSRIIEEAGDIGRRAYLTGTREALDKELRKLHRCKEVLDKKKTYSVDELVRRYTDNSLNGRLFTFMDRLIDNMKADSRHRTAAIYSVARRSFADFRQGADIPIEDIDQGLIRGYETYLKGRLVSMNTISCYMRVWRAVYNRAVEEGLSPQQQPFKNVYTGVAKTAKRAINETLIARLKELDLEPEAHLSLARDLFMFSFYTRGMSFVDMANLKREHIRKGYITYKRSKTKQLLTIRLEPCIENIIERYRSHTVGDYLLPIYHRGNRDATSTLRTYNKRLERISAMMDLDKPLTSYVARHSWATIAMRKGIPMSIISEGMGHESEHTTRIYLAAIEQSTLDQANAQIISL
ncbi:MAG: site-specific integrase [Tannerellaceae bacterium]|jgi:site-specific recombinase XerD|nr:site-specific integrase [Tannerellaceae bacterium]